MKGLPVHGDVCANNEHNKVSIPTHCSNDHFIPFFKTSQTLSEFSQVVDKSRLCTQMLCILST